MASYQYIYVMKGLTKYYPGGKRVLNNIWLSFFPGAKIGIIGVNGSGKSTLLKIMAGLDQDFTGEAWAADGVKVGFLSQDPELNLDKTVYDNILEGVKEKQKLLDDFQAISMRFAEDISADEMNELLEKQAKLQEEIDACDAWNIELEINMAMEALRCPDKDSIVGNLSGGEKRRVAICKLLLSKPDLLLLDEPTNHLDAQSVAWLENYLKNYGGTVVLVTHDRYFLDNVTGWILELDNGDGIPWEGNYSGWLEQKEKRLAEEKKVDESRRKVLQSELEWIRQSPKARQSKSKARINAYNDLLESHQRIERTNAQIIIPDGPRLGSNVIKIDNIAKCYGDRVLMDNLSFEIMPGAIVGIIGPNGVGKTTLFKMIAGIEKPDNGNITVGDTVRIGYVDQIRATLNLDKTVWEEISDGQEEMILGKDTIKSRAYCSAFNFRGSDQQKKLSVLSGGELNRVNLAKILKGGYNVIMLDEPTNDLDVDTLRALEEAIYDFAGCILVTSHDRWFLDRIATHILAFEDDGSIEWFPGNFAEYEEYKIKKFGKDALTPKRVKYKKLLS